MSEIIGKHEFVVNKKDNGGESVTISTEIHDNGDKTNNIWLSQTITLMSYCNSASFTLCGSPLTPEILRELANELDKTIATAQTKVHF